MIHSVQHNSFKLKIDKQLNHKPDKTNLLVIRMEQSNEIGK